MTSEAWEVAFEEYKETIPSPARDLPSVSREYYFIAVAPVFRAGHQAAAPRWIPVEERLPVLEDGRVSRTVLCLTADFVCKEAHLYYEEWRDWDDNTIAPVTHWQPLPPLPEEGK